MSTNTNTAFEEVKKAQEIIMGAIDKSTRANLASIEKLMELNKQSFSGGQDLSNPADFVARQSTTFKEYADQLNQQFETLTSIGNESREQLTELSQEFAKNLDFSSFFQFPQPESKAKAKPAAKS